MLPLWARSSAGRRPRRRRPGTRGWRRGVATKRRTLATASGRPSNATAQRGPDPARQVGTHSTTISSSSGSTAAPTTSCRCTRARTGVFAARRSRAAGAQPPVEHLSLTDGRRRSDRSRVNRPTRPTVGCDRSPALTHRRSIAKATRCGVRRSDRRFCEHRDVPQSASRRSQLRSTSVGARSAASSRSARSNR